jgi:tetratricopeptide (TPR) repeat protein
MGIRNLIRGLWRGSADNPTQTNRASGRIIHGIEVSAVASMAKDDEGITAMHKYVGLHHEDFVQSCDELIKDDPTDSLYYGIRGQALFVEGQFSRAITDLTEAIRLDPFAPVVHAWYLTRGSAYSNIEEFDRAIVDLTAATEAGVTLAYPGLALAYAKSGDDQGAIQVVSKNIDICPTDPKLYATRGTIYELLAEYELAIADFSRAIELDPHKPDVYAKRARCFMEISDLNRAIVDFSKAIELDRHKPDFYAMRARCFLEMRDHERAIADGNMAIKLDPLSMVGHEARGTAYAMTGVTDRAIVDLTKAIDLGSKRCYLFRAQAFMAKGDRENCLADMNEHMQLRPPGPEAFQARGAIRSLTGDTDGAIADFSKAIDLEPENADHYRARAREYSKLGDTDGTIGDLSKAIDLEPENAGHYGARAEAYLKGRDDRRAIADYDQAIYFASESDEQELSDWFRWRGMAYMRDGDLDQAIEDGSRVISFVPANVNGYVLRGMSHRRKGEFERAIADLTKACELDPNSAEIDFFRREIELARRGVQ